MGLKFVNPTLIIKQKVDRKLHDRYLEALKKIKDAGWTLDMQSDMERIMRRVIVHSNNLPESAVEVAPKVEKTIDIDEMVRAANARVAARIEQAASTDTSQTCIR